MSERDVDIDFDFFEEEPPTEEPPRAERVIRRPGPRGPRRPPRAPQNLTPLLRLVGLVAFAILIIVLLVFWIKSCQASSKSSTYKNYMSQNSELASTTATTAVVERLKGASAGTKNCPCGTSLVSTKLLPSGTDLSTSNTNTIQFTVSTAFQVTVKNSGNVQVFSVPVKLTIEQSKGGNIVKTTKIGFLNTGDETTLTFRNFPQPNFAAPATLKIEVSPVNGETNTGNNSADYPVIFSVG